MSPRYDPALPILAELEEEVRRAAERRLECRPAERRRLTAARPNEPSLGRAGQRIVRRALVLVALALLVGATALAATGALVGGGNDPAIIGRALEVTRGPAGGGYRFVVHRDGHSLCRVLIFSDGLTSRCQLAPAGVQVQPLSGLNGARRLVVGLTGPLRRSLHVAVAGRDLKVRTHPLDRRTALAAGIDPRLRFFAVSFAALSGSVSQPPAFVGGQVDCGLTTTPTVGCTRP